MATYKTCFVAYLDILGFRFLIERLNSGQVEQLRYKLGAALPLWSTPKGSSPIAEYRGKIFSDSITMSVPINRVEAPHFLLHVANFQGALASIGIFVRGAVVCGNHYEDREVLFGPAMIHAADLEGAMAIWPRVVVHPDVLDICYHCDTWSDFDQAASGGIGPLLRKDSDGITYLNYIRMYYGSFDSPELAGQFLTKHRDHVIEKAREAAGNLRRLAKYYWLATYHNSETAELNRIDVQIDSRGAFPDL